MAFVSDRWTVPECWITNATRREYGCGQNLFYHFRRADDYWGDYRLREGGQPSIYYRRLDHGSLVAHRRIIPADASRSRTRDRIHYLSSSRRSIHSQIYPHR